MESGSGNGTTGTWLTTARRLPAINGVKVTNAPAQMTPTTAGANLAQALTGRTTAERKDGMMPPVY